MKMKQSKTKFSWHYVNGLKQEPKNLDFHITPCITFGRSSDRSNWGLFIEWGHWAFGFACATVQVDDGGLEFTKWLLPSKYSLFSNGSWCEKISDGEYSAKEYTLDDLYLIWKESKKV